MPRIECTLDFGHVAVKLHEPTVGQIRSLLGREDLSFDPLGFLSGKSEIPTDIISLVAEDLSQEVISKLTLSECKEMMEKARELLSPFFDIARMLNMASGYLSIAHPLP